MVFRGLKHFKCYLYAQKITVRMDNSAVSWLHGSTDPVGQPARWIDVIDTYDVTFQHWPGWKHGNADALSRYPCCKCGGEFDRTPTQGVQVVTRSHVYKPGWNPEDLSTEQDADPDIGPLMRWKRARDDRPRWEDISPPRDTKLLWRQWEQLSLVHGVLYRQFHELEGRGWWYQLVVPEGRRKDLLRCMHRGAPGTPAPIHCRGSDGTFGDGRGRAVPHHLL